jgi:hypothetical protein
MCIFLSLNSTGDKDNALKQIRDKKYFEKYQGVGKEIYLFGVEFTDRNIAAILIMEFDNIFLLFRTVDSIVNFCKL